MTTDYFFTNFNSLWDSFTTGGGAPAWPPTGRRSWATDTCKLPSSPPCDCALSEDLNNLYLTFALAGYAKKDIEVSASNNSITMKTKKFNTAEESNVIHNGISKKAHNVTLAIDESFDPKQAEVDFINGLLKIVIPRTEEGKTVKLL
jgi:HSP20 family molecular chaperone IbpA